MAKLSILIPSRNEKWLQKTIEDIFEHAEGDTEVLVGLDGEQRYDYADTPYKNPEKIRGRLRFAMDFGGVGQRAMTNKLASLSKAQYLMKIDAHCSFSQGFDVKMIEVMKMHDDNIILAPQMGVLNPDIWAINGRKMTTRYCFDKSFVMKYGEEDNQLNPETMCLQGSAWMITRENYWKWNVCDETLGSWGGQAVELGIAAHINGGRCLSTRHAFYGHVFRHKDEEFPYERGESPGKFATEELKRRYENDPRIAELASKFNVEWN